VSRSVHDRGAAEGASKIIYRDPPTSTKLVRVSLWVGSHSFYLIYCYSYIKLFVIEEGDGFERSVPGRGDRQFETAHRLGRRVAAHAHGAAGINAALEAGVDSIEHGSFLDARSLELFIAKGAFHVPTIIAGVTVLEMAQGDGLLTTAQIEKAMIVGVKIKEALARSHKAGVTIAFGTDMGVGPHGQNAREFGFMVEAGMRSREAIKAATVNAAKLLDLSDEVGTIASGKSADVIAVDSSPLDDVSVLQRMAFVMARGDVYLGVT
jgi:imidazolonepropionase-like amidohydrolase